MNVLHVVAGELTGGAARGAYWLHQGLRELGVHSQLLSSCRETHGDRTVVSLGSTPWRAGTNLLRKQLDLTLPTLYPLGRRGAFSTGLFGRDFTRTEAYRAADVIHLHWISAGMVKLQDLSRIGKPVIWTLRDMWPMTGGCHYTLGCERFTGRCGRCPQLGSHSEYDLSTLVQQRKRTYLPRQLWLVGISQWLAEQARASRVFAGRQVRVIANSIDTREFFPIDKPSARALLGIHTDKKLVLSGAISAKDPYKGFDRYLQALALLDPRHYHLCFFGHVDRSVVEALPFDYSDLGYLHDAIGLRLAYSAADVFVAPSVMEAFGKTLAESMACGTPVVCFDATGPRDIVSHRVDGYKARPFAPEDLAAGIRWVSFEADYPALCRQARESVLARFDNVVVARQYLALYGEALALGNSEIAAVSTASLGR